MALVPIGSATATARLSGMSITTPYAAGMWAVALGKYGQVSLASRKGQRNLAHSFGEAGSRSR